MRNALKFLLTLVAATVLMLVVRAFVFAVYTVDGASLAPLFHAGDRVVVNRWGYGLRVGGGDTVDYTRWLRRPIGRNELVAFNYPLGKACQVEDREVYICVCTAVPGDTVRQQGMYFVMPGKRVPVNVTSANMRLLCYIYNKYEPQMAAIRQHKLYVDGQETMRAYFTRDYYWMSSGNPKNCNDSRFFGPVPESYVIGSVVAVLPALFTQH